MSDFFNKLKSVFPQENRLTIIVFAGIFGIVLILASDFTESGNDYPKNENSLEQRLSSTLESIDGIGKTNVMIKLSSDEKEICGVIVVCEGGGSAVIQEKVSTAVSSLFGISPQNIYIAQLSAE